MALLQSLLPALQTLGFADARGVFEAFIPLIKLTDPVTSFEVDIVPLQPTALANVCYVKQVIFLLGLWRRKQSFSRASRLLLPNFSTNLYPYVYLVLCFAVRGFGSTCRAIINGYQAFQVVTVVSFPVCPRPHHKILILRVFICFSPVLYTFQQMPQHRGRISVHVKLVWLYSDG